MDNLKSSLQEINNDDYSTINNLYSSRRSSLAEILKSRKMKEKNKLDIDSFGYSTGFDFYNNKNKLDNDNYHYDLSSEKQISERKLESKDDKDDDFDNNKEYKSKLIKKR